MQDGAKVYFVVHGKLTTTADNNLGEVRMAELPDRILITVAKCHVRTHHNALRFSITNHYILGRCEASWGEPERDMAVSRSCLVTAYSAKTRRFQNALESECE